MNGKEVDTFSQRLMNELNVLPWQDRNELLIKIGRAEMRMRALGQERPLWRGPLSEPDLLGKDVVVSTGAGEQRGRVICFGITQMPDGIDYEKSVIIHFPASGTHHEAPASLARVANSEDKEMIREEVEMAKRLSEANEAIASGPTPLKHGRAPKKRGERDPKLVEKMLAAANSSQNVRGVEEGGANHKVVGIDGRKRMYVFKNQLRVDISGFEVDHPAVRKISEQEAKDMHLGKVRGQIVFTDREVAFAAFCHALEMMEAK